MKKIIFIIFLLLSSCFCGYSKPTRFYNLITYRNKVISHKRFSINIEPIIIPSYLDKSQIITIGEKETELNISETNRWAEPLDIGIQRALIQDLQSSIPNAMINFKQKNKNDYLVSIKINKFISKFNENVVFDVFYTIKSKNGKNVSKNIIFESKISDNYWDLVENYSKLINDLSIEIAKKIIY